MSLSASPSVRLIPATERVDRVHFSGAREWHDHAIDVGTYTCPHCGATVEFNTGTLRSAEKWSESPLGASWHERCQDARKLGAWEWGLDFKCPGCDCPVRVVFVAAEEYSMGAHNHMLVTVLEQVDCNTK